MAKLKTRPRAKTKKRPFVPIHRDAAGLDVGATFHVAAVPAGRDPASVRSFKSFTGDLHELADWFTTVGITTIAMGSTGVYSIPVFEILEARGFEVLLVNARDVKNVPGRKTDVNDAQWLQRLHEHGLLRGRHAPASVAPELLFIREYYAVVLIREHLHDPDAGRAADAAHDRGVGAWVERDENCRLVGVRGC
jgi:hypothetical protein